MVPDPVPEAARGDGNAAARSRTVKAMPTPSELLETAQAAVASGDWATARSAFEALTEHEPSAEALAGLGDVLWWLGETDKALRCQEQAYAAFQHRGDPANSAMIAVGLYLTYRVSLGNVAAARGWLARASRLVAEADLAPLEGWVRLLRAHDCVDPVAAKGLASDAYDLALRFGDRDLELCALSQLGASLVRQGRGEEGTGLLDEAMAASLAGESTRPHTVVYTSCTVISACAQTAEFDHALQWIRAADAFEQRYGNPHLYTTCRTYLGAILFASGDWVGAERELRAALDIGVSAEPAALRRGRGPPRRAASGPGQARGGRAAAGGVRGVRDQRRGCDRAGDGTRRLRQGAEVGPAALARPGWGANGWGANRSARLLPPRARSLPGRGCPV